jgi:acetylornithine deacetylase/succinyl-diaminopimelate desuccinylase-like protein
VTSDHLAQRALALVAAPSETGSEHPAVDLIASWLEPVADEVDRWVTPMSELEGDPAYPGREVERDEVPVVAARVAGNRPGPVGGAHRTHRCGAGRRSGAVDARSGRRARR